MGVPPDTAPTLTVAGKSYKSVLRWDLRGDLRFFLFAIVAVMMIDWLYLRTPLSATRLRVSIVLVALYVAWPVIRGTYLLHKNKSELLHAGYKFVDAEIALPELGRVSIHQVESLGFRRAACLEKATNHPLVTVFCCILVHPTRGDMAQVATVKSSLRTRYLTVFNAAFDDGLILETGNGHDPPLFRKETKYVTFRFPRLRTALDQYILHRRLVEEYSRARKPLVGTPGQVVAKFLANAEELHALRMNRPDYKLSDSKDRYVYTWRGALRISLIRHWPVGALRRIRLYSDADKVLKRLGFRLDPKLGHLAGVDRAEEMKRFAGN